MTLFVGTFENKVDRKGRVSFPASFRARLAGDDAGGIYLYPSLKSRAVEGCTLAWMGALRSGLSGLGAYSEERRRLARVLAARARLVKLDDDGRLVLPRDLAEFAEISETAAFVGLFEVFEIWNPAHAARAEAEALNAVTEADLGRLIAGGEGGGA